MDEKAVSMIVQDYIEIMYDSLERRILEELD
jgi:hypothetical protein